MAEHLTTRQAGRIDAVLADLLEGLSRSRLAALIKEGRVEVEGERITRPAAKIPAGARVVVDLPPPRPATAPPQDLPLDIVYQDADIAVINKAPGMVVHPSAGHEEGTLVNALLHHLDDLSGVGGVERPGIVHRLDRGTSGLIVVAKRDEAHWSLADQFAVHSAGRRYLALTLGAPHSDSGTIRSRLARHPTDRLRWASTDREEEGKEAITHWRVVGRGALTLVECVLETGRTHQIRVHLTEAGWPLAGDPVYKRRGHRVPPQLVDLIGDDRPMLHAWQLQLDHPLDGVRRTYYADPPQDFTALARAAGLFEALDALLAHR
ncbi:MAG: RluA family pseudouridine synthase [Deltaproteobacteria bacterium]|nr:RluA family pseudouridine synthase [Deltaproteobacteria bacterium]